ncbi:hypothetical protein [Phyllobacterium zundukense]|uniref:Uncharacterized protein n=1 Tax=Phyllobacterium zundukense TaxID=1867719 RepID=A0ACD4CYQ0_9HYPH|nr:hypothetical protein [Phyllobacterium zundukense]UXN58721.1 hypothetical protein N8E88_12195 [Phyllobacterium zundukense]
MAKYQIVDDSDTNKLWLVNMETHSAEYLDREVIGSLGLAGLEFLNSINKLTNRGIAAGDSRSNASERALSFDGRSQPSERALSFDGRSDPSERALFFDGRCNPFERARSAGPAALD